jgi:hypothetical protein
MGKRIRLVEKLFSHIPIENIVITEKSLLIESGGQSYNSRALVKDVPISRYTVNQNDRIYKKSLWEDVFKKGSAENSYALVDHPEDEGSLNNICGIWRNLKVGDQLVTADLYLITEKGGHILEILQAGGPVGVSTVGYGEIDKSDGKTVIPETYDLQRAGDLVMEPSQQVYATAKNLEPLKSDNEEKNKPGMEYGNPNTDVETKASGTKENEEIEKKEEQIQEKTVNILVENSTNNKEEKLENKQISNEINEVKRMDKLQETNFNMHVHGIIKEAKKNSNLTEAIEDLKMIEIPTEHTGHAALQGKVDSAISELQSKLVEGKQNAEKSLSAKEKEFKELKTKYDSVCKIAEDMKVKYNKAKALIEKAGISENPKNIKKMEEELNSLMESKKIVGSKLKGLLKERHEMIDDIKHFIEDRRNMKSDLKCFISEKKSLIEKYNALVKKYNEKLKKTKIYVEALEDMGYDFKLGTPKEDQNAGEVKEDIEDVPVDFNAAETKEDQSDVEGLKEDEDEIEEDGDNEPYEFTFGDDEKKEEVCDEPDGDEVKEDAQPEDWDLNRVPAKPVVKKEEAEEELPYEDGNEKVEEVNPMDGGLSGQDVKEEDEMNPEVEEDITADSITRPEMPKKVEEEDDEYEVINDEEKVAEEIDDTHAGDYSKENGKLPFNGLEEVDDDEDEIKITEEDEEEIVTGDVVDEPKKESKVVKKKVTESRISKEQILQQEIKKYIEDEITRTPALKDVKVNILKSSSFMEAVNKVNKFKAMKNKVVKKDSPVRFTESKKHQEVDWLGSRN